ncbi:CBS domain-containing protein [Thalassotalea atypica]|uniref:CBS domain-containing protein n=1 Tax=Thalassotalea atypica TaxID=2054316 RepID=UPI0025746680|nr:CBS domain-containing protein [Thalassotalea atypica]
MNVTTIMSSPIMTVQLDDKLALVNEIFSNKSFHHLVVVENSKLYGVVSDRDLLKAISPHIGTAAERHRDVATLNRKVHQVMSRKPISIEQSQDVYDAITLFMNNKISCIPVVDNDNIPIGIISWRDILKAIKKPKSLSNESK